MPYPSPQIWRPARLTTKPFSICPSSGRGRSLIVAALFAVAVAGCQKQPAATNGAAGAKGKQGQQESLRAVERSESLLRNAASELNDLPSAVDTEVRPPQVIIDSRNSGDGQDVFAICVANPNVPNSPANIIRVVNGNGRFRSLNVRPGDVVKYFIREDKTVDEDSRRSGLARQTAMDLKVAKVIDDNTLLIEGGLNQDVSFPAKIEVWRNVDDRLKAINDKLVLYDTRRLPAVGWEPAPDEQDLTQVLAWLNQWIRQANPPSEWKRDPLLDTLPDELKSDPELKRYLSAPALAEKSFRSNESRDPQALVSNDGRILQEAVWLRDISKWAHGNDFDDVSRATALFDWTVRNIQLEADAGAVPHRPWHILLYGRGTAAQRAWVFALLARQQGLNVVVLGVPAAKPADGTAEAVAAPMIWLPALFSKGQLYLFDPQLGLPILGPDGKGVATLEQALKDDSLLRKLDLEGAPYPVSSESLKGVKAFIVADPFELSRRASQLEATLSGENHLALAVSPSEVAEQLKSVPGLTGVELWEVPFSTLRDQLTLGKSARHDEAIAFEPFAVRPALWKARTRHFQGRHKTAEEAGGEPLDDHQEAARLYMSKSVRPTDREISGSLSSDKQRVDSLAKLNATYWLGLLSYDDGKEGVAATWFGRPELIAPDSPVSSGALYNLARSLEAQEKFDEAAVILEKDTSPQQHGNKVRARELKARPKPVKPAEPAPAK